MTLDDLERLMRLMRVHGASHVSIDGTSVVLGMEPRAQEPAVAGLAKDTLRAMGLETPEAEQARLEYEQWLHGKKGTTS